MCYLYLLRLKLGYYKKVCVLLCMVQKILSSLVQC